VDARGVAVDGARPARAAGDPLTGIRVANAPCSFGAFEITVGVLPNVPRADEVLAAIVRAGYEGTELGPPGFLGDETTLRANLERHGLALAGGYIPVAFSEPERRQEGLAATAQTLDLFEAAGATGARPVLADAGSARRAANPGRAEADRSLGLDDAEWSRLAEGVERVAAYARGRGFEPTFHPHTGTFVEAPWEIERLLELTDVGLVLDTGHVALGGGDPVRALVDWTDRIDHVHVKDYRRSVLDSVLAERADMAEAWRRGVFCELGAGDVDLDGFFRALRGSGYSEWLVVEQDRIPRPDEDPAEAAEAQLRNRRWLAEHAGL
jgi:inosose dehydratase